MTVFSNQESPPDLASIWNQFRECSLADVKAAAEYCTQHSREHEKYSRDNAHVDKLKSSVNSATSAHDLSIRGSVLHLLTNHMVRHGPKNVPAWSELPQDEKQSLVEAMAASDYNPRKTKRAVEAIAEYLRRTSPKRTPDKKGDFFAEVASDPELRDKHDLRGGDDQIWNRVDGYCRDHGIKVPSNPNEYREILNIDEFKN